MRPSVFDRLAVVWLLAIPFAPFLAWVIGSLATVNVRTWRWVLGAEAFLCVALPLICVLPLLRYVRGRAAPYSLLILFLGTLFPGRDRLVVRRRLRPRAEMGARKRRQQHQGPPDYRGRDIPTRTLKVRLADGRVLEADAEQVDIRTGACRILVLQSSRRYLTVERESRRDVHSDRCRYRRTRGVLPPGGGGPAGRQAREGGGPGGIDVNKKGVREPNGKKDRRRGKVAVPTSI